VTPENSALLETYRLEGLIGEQFKPAGETASQQRSSIEARAYTTWIKRNAELCGNHPPETCRSAFQMRHDPNWSMPPLSVPEMPMASALVAGFSTPRSILPRGDAYEGPEETLFPEPADVPPPQES